jgi:rhamnose transport system ATP-binding protein
VRGLARPPVVNDVSFEIRAGEIVGVAGLVGAGRSETARLIAGADRLQSGRIEVDGQELLPKRPSDSIRRGVVMLPESRKTQGLVMGSSVKDNTTVAYLGDMALAGVVNVHKERTVTQKLVDLFDVRAAGQGIAVEDLSGGNQQKVALAKWLLHQPKVLIVDEPTQGVDIGAKTKIYEVLADFAASGCAIMLISSELPEVLGLAHRVLVMANGRLVAEFGPGCTEDEVLEAAFHTDPSTPPSAVSLNEAS